MLKKITKLQHIGLFHNKIKDAVIFDRITLLYAENGRGKSTFADLLRFCSKGDISGILAKKTIDAAEESKPEVSFLFELDGKPFPINFVEDAWDKKFENLVIFDDKFVDKNVYSGDEVRPDQRETLLEFALGEEAVLLKQQIGGLTKNISEVTQSRSNAEKEIAKFSRQIPVSQFIKVDAIVDAKQQIEAIRKRIESAKNSQALIKRQDPVLLSVVEFDVDSFFKILDKQLVDIQNNVETVIHKHLEKHSTASNMEDWLSKGQIFLKNDNCPFCAQSLDSNILIEAYKSYFNKAYADLKQEVSVLKRGAEVRLADSKIDNLEANISTNAARMEAWIDQIQITVPVLSLDPLRKIITTVREMAVNLAIKKQNQPLESFSAESDKNAISVEIEKINMAITSYNKSLMSVIEKITVFKRELSAEDVPVLEQQIKSFELSIARYEPAAIKAIEEYQQAESNRKNLDNEKAKKREELDKLMTHVLTQYQTKINELLEIFGAGFRIEDMKRSYQGTGKGTGEPRIDYALQLRKKSVRLGGRNDAGLHFGTVLSNGDKRTLAFAFFLARIEVAHENIKNKIFVLDDPVSSLDRNRRAQTVERIESLSHRCAQLLIFSHDAYFLREVREKFSNGKKQAFIPSIIEISRIQNDYSAFSGCDLDNICSSDYYRHYCCISDYVNGNCKNDIRDVAKVLRPLLEGFYHRKFPLILTTSASLGQIIADIEQAIDEENPLFHVKGNIDELREVNKYSSLFHHDTNPSIDTVSVTDGELKTYAKRILNLIYK